MEKTAATTQVRAEGGILKWELGYFLYLYSNSLGK